MRTKECGEKIVIGEVDLYVSGVSPVISLEFDLSQKVVRKTRAYLCALKTASLSSRLKESSFRIICLHFSTFLNLNLFCVISLVNSTFSWGKNPYMTNVIISLMK